MNELTLPIRNLVGQPIRTGLTIFGVAVAVAGFIALTGLTEGVQHSFSSGLQEPGADFLVTERNPFSVFSSSIHESLGPTLSAVEGVEAVSGVLLNVTTADEGANIVAAGWTPGSFLWHGVHLIDGRLPQQPAESSTVLGKAIADGLGKHVGDSIELADEPYEVIGVASFASVLNQNIAIVPLASLQALIDRAGTVTLFEVRLKRPFDAGQAAAVKSRLRAAAAGFNVSDSDEFASNVQLIQLLQAIGSTVSLVILIMATLVIANTLLMAVNERTFEIGILAAIGWRPARILRLILVEGVVMSAVGGVVGLGLGILTMNLISRAEVAAGLLESYLTAGIVVRATIAALIAGPLGALYPAWRATRLVPAEALRRN
jgi:putative ABC transport system permease protein